MIALDEDALICDFAETYQIYDYRSLPVKLAATLAAGLRDDSRIRLLVAGSKVDQDTILLALIADKVEAFRYGFTEDASNGRNRPHSIVMALLGEQEDRTSGFESGEAFKEALARIRGDK